MHNILLLIIFKSGGDILSVERDEAIHTINEAKEKIISIKKKLEEKSNQLPKLEDLKEQFDNFYCLLEKKQSDIQRDLKELSSMIDEINEKQVVLLNEKKEVMLATIRANLPYGMKIEPEDNNIKEGLLKYENGYIGELKIVQENDSIITYVSVNNSKQSFPVKDELGMYAIINYIITEFNYPKSF